MKKVLAIILVALTIATILVSCKATQTPSENATGTPTAKVEGPKKYELALVTDIGTIDDKSFNQGAWEGLEKYAKEKNITYKYYQPSEKTTDAYIAGIDLAVAGGAKVVVTPGFMFEPAVFKAQDKYPDIKFVLLDGTPQDGTYKEFRIEKNVQSIFYAEEQSGFLAGYAAVKEGMTKLGFMGGMAVPAVVRFGYGFVQGAEYAAKELALPEGSIELKYAYLGGFAPDPAYQTMAASWFNAGTEVIFAAAGGAGSSVMAAAEQTNKKVIGVDVDQSAESKIVITSAQKMLANSVYMALTDYYTNAFKGGISTTLDVKSNGVGLPADFSRFTKFTKEQYDVIYDKLVKDTDGITTAIRKDKVGDKTVNLADITVKFVKVTEIK